MIVSFGRRILALTLVGAFMLAVGASLKFAVWGQSWAVNQDGEVQDQGAIDDAPPLTPTEIPGDPVPVYQAQVVAQYPHDRTAFSQGLIYHDGFFYEGTGRYGHSTIRRVEPRTGRVRQIQNLSDSYFGEGITLWNDKIIQLTWKAGLAAVWDRSTFQLEDQFRYEGEGWGLTNDGTSLIMSDGSDTLRFIDPTSHETTKELEVDWNGRPVNHLNELEYIQDLIWANIWQKPYIVCISPEDGSVVAWIDLTPIIPPRLRYPDQYVANGIAYDPEGKRLFVTGKCWPVLYQITLIPPANMAEEETEE
jgi:glutaminyl-peptide cyclotransferase